LSTTAIRGAYACRFALRAIEQSSNREDDVSRPLTTLSARFYFEKALLLHSATLPLCHSASLWRGEPKRPWNPGSRFFNHFSRPLIRTAEISNVGCLHLHLQYANIVPTTSENPHRANCYRTCFLCLCRPCSL
jgi:hypothetical protein